MKVLLRSRSLAAAGLLALTLLALVPGTAFAKPEPGYRPRGFRLFARALGGLTINRVALGLRAAEGTVGGDSTGSSTIGGGFWPKGTANQFVYNSGLQIAGIISNPGGTWDNDTTGSFFFNARGGGNGALVENIYNFNNPADAGAWPAAAKVPLELNPADNFYDPALTGLNSASQGDVWFVTWDGNPSLSDGRDHPLGVAVETRGLGWNFPTGNEDIVYFVFTFYNVTASNPAVYSQVRSDMRPIMQQLGQQFVASSEKQYGITLPADGYTIKEMYSGFGADMDVASAGVNYCTVNMPFAMGYCYEHTFTPTAGEQYSNPTIWGAPFFAGPGFVGVKYLRSPTGAGKIQLFSNTVNSTAAGPSLFPDANNVTQLWRYLSGKLSPTAGDLSCNVAGGQPGLPADPAGICFVATSAGDARFFQSSTPLTLAPGELKSIVVAYIFAAPVAVPNFTPGQGPGLDVKPGNPVRLNNAALLASGANLIDSLTGFAGFTDANGDLEVTQNEIKTVPASLLNKALTAQTIFDNQFLLPFSPAAPNFYLIPGNNQVTVVWQPSASEISGDPYFGVASVPGVAGQPNLLYDPNFRQYDVEGYRVYRGRVNNASELTLVAQFDYSGTQINDFTGQVNPVSTCRPELGVVSPTGCTYDFVVGSGVAPTVSVAHELVGDFVQVKLGGPYSVVLSDTTAMIVPNSADTALTAAGNGGYPPLANTGVPFAFIDNEPKNNFRYFYAVTAFDLNSIQSGPSSLESPRTGKAVTPSVQGTNTANATLVSGLYGDGPNQLNVSAPFTIDAATGIFSGTPPATNGVDGAFAPLVPALLPAFNLTATIDSVTAYFVDNEKCGGVSNGFDACYIFYVTFNKDGVETKFVTVTPWPMAGGPPAPASVQFDATANIKAQLGAQPIAIDPTAAARYGMPGTLTGNASVGISEQQYIQFSSFEGQAARRGMMGNNGGVNVALCPTAANCSSAVSPGGSRWFQGANETLPHPAVAGKVGSGLTGVDTVWAPIHHVQQDPNNSTTPTPPANSGTIQFFGYGFAGLSREADVVVTWGTGGALASVHDITHDVPVPFSTNAAASWGFVRDGGAASVVPGVVEWSDFNFPPNVAEWWPPRSAPLGRPMWPIRCGW